MESNWQQEYSVGHPVLDEQHKGFFALCRKAEAGRHDRSREGVERFHELLNELVNYANRHFLTEEKVLAACCYPHLDAHRAEHEIYRETLTGFVIKATFGDMDTDGVLAYLAEWWRDHILQSDMQYRRYLVELLD